MRRGLQIACLQVLVLSLWTSIASAEVVDVKAHVETTVEEILNGATAQSDHAALDFPSTAKTLPVVVRGSLSRTDPAGTFLSGARGLVQFSNVAAPLSSARSNIGFDIAAFSTTPQSGWSVDAIASERRTIVMQPAEIGIPNGLDITVSASISFSGVLFLTSQDPKQDFTGAEANMEFSILQERSGGSKEVLSGRVSLVGDGVAGAKSTTSGPFNALLTSVIPLDNVVTEFPILRAVIFSGVLPTDQLSYVYDGKVGEAFDLTLTVHSSLKTPPGQIGAAVVFGVPQEGFADLFLKAKNSDAGARLQDTISTLVDTTGQNQPAANSSVRLSGGLFNAFPATCGTFGMEAVGLATFGLIAGIMGSVRQRRLRRGR